MVLLAVDLAMTGYDRTVQINEINERFKTNYKTWTNSRWYEFGDQLTGDLINSSVQMLDLLINIHNLGSVLESIIYGGPVQWNDYFATDAMSNQYRVSALSLFSSWDFQKNYGIRAVYSANTGKHKVANNIASALYKSAQEIQNISKEMQTLLQQVNDPNKLITSDHITNLSIIFNKITAFIEDIQDVINGDYTKLISKLSECLPKKFKYQNEDNISTPNIVIPVIKVLLQCLQLKINDSYNIFTAQQNASIENTYNQLLGNKQIPETDKEKISQIKSDFSKLPEDFSGVLEILRRVK